ncbi:MAG: photosystem II protein PsbQ [Cyanobacteria bacterium J06621_8]
MKIFRPILSLVLVLVTTLLVSCGGPNASAPPTYTPEELQKVKAYRAPLIATQKRLPQLGEYLDNEDWVNADSFIHGSLGSVRRNLTYLSKSLLPSEQKPALKMARDIFRHLERIDAAVAQRDFDAAREQYREVVDDLDNYASLIPDVTALTESAE